MKSLLLVDLILGILEQGDSVTAKKVSRITGEDVVRVTSELQSLASKGVLKVKQVRSEKYPTELPFDVFTPMISRVRNQIDIRNGDRQ